MSVISRLSMQRSRIKWKIADMEISQDGARWLNKMLTDKIEEMTCEYKVVKG